MSNYIFKYVFITTLVLLASCGADVQNYIQYVEAPANGLSIIQKQGVFELHAQYKPVEYVLLKERHVEPSKSKEWNNIRNELDGLQYFSFSIKRQDGESITKTGFDNPASSALDPATYFSFDLERDFYLFEGGDSLPCVLFHWPRQFDLAPEETFMLAFPKANKAGDKTFVFNDRVLGIGQQRFEISQKSINSIPEIN